MRIGEWLIKTLRIVVLTREDCSEGRTSGNLRFEEVVGFTKEQLVALLD
jgi:hypothetical protein